MAPWTSFLFSWFFVEPWDQVWKQVLVWYRHGVLRAIRLLLCLPPLVVDKRSAVSIAKRECEARGVPWVEPVSVSTGLRNHKVVTMDDRIGGYAVITLSVHSGEVRSFGVVDDFSA